jgi:DNA-binding PadR family transcriptional regulator
VISRLSDRTTMYHNALVVALRTAAQPLSAPDLVAHMPWVQQTRPHPNYRGPRCTTLPHQRSDHGRILRCDGINHVVEVRPAAHQLYGFLCRLERDGLVARAAGSVEGRRILWELTDRGRAGADIDDVRRIVNPDASDFGGTSAVAADAVVGDEELQALAAAAEQASARYLAALRRRRDSHTTAGEGAPDDDR